MSGNNGQSRNGQKHRGNTGGANNLRPPWKPGESGNPGGRPKGRGITQTLRGIVESEDGSKAKEIAEAVLEGAIKAARDGDPRMLKELLDRLEGPVKQHVETELHQLVYDIKMPGTEDVTIDRR